MNKRSLNSKSSRNAIGIVISLALLLVGQAMSVATAGPILVQIKTIGIPDQGDLDLDREEDVVRFNSEGEFVGGVRRGHWDGGAYRFKGVVKVAGFDGGGAGAFPCCVTGLILTDFEAELIFPEDPRLLTVVDFKKTYDNEELENGFTADHHIQGELLTPNERNRDQRVEFSAFADNKRIDGTLIFDLASSDEPGKLHNLFDLPQPPGEDNEFRKAEGSSLELRGHLVFKLAEPGDKLLLPKSADVGFTLVVPEPSTWLLLGLGSVGVFGYHWRQRRAPC